MPRVALIAQSELRSAPLRRILLDGLPPLLLVAREDDYFVLEDTCGHGAASLSEGELAGDEILCPHHRGAFDIRSGRPTRPPCIAAQRAYPVSVADGMLYIDVP